MTTNYGPVNYLRGTDSVAIGASATESVLVSNIDLSSDGSLHFRIRVVCSAVKEAAGISWKLQHSWDDGSSWEDVSRGGTDATVNILGFTVADADVATATDRIAETAHGLKTGDAIYYACSGAGVITGLTANTIYYVIRVDADLFKLATTLALALAGTAIDLTQPASGHTHYIARTESELVLNVENTTDEALLPLYPKARIVVTTGAADVFTATDVWHARRV